ncbi:hypothetical protein ASA1KI_05590 [Opitutales bacterium ASA1]|nr:hypothetical protein ASA1KI_05590 [Opitutales bacterium ASA1]
MRRGRINGNVAASALPAARRQKPRRESCGGGAVRGDSGMAWEGGIEVCRGVADDGNCEPGVSKRVRVAGP